MNKHRFKKMMDVGSGGGGGGKKGVERIERLVTFSFAHFQTSSKYKHGVRYPNLLLLLFLLHPSISIKIFFFLFLE
jgi:hypothetical protein